MNRAVLNNVVVLSLCLLPALPSPGLLAQENAAGVEEVIAIGRQPGPKMWKATNGENTLVDTASGVDSTQGYELGWR